MIKVWWEWKSHNLRKSQQIKILLYKQLQKQKIMQGIGHTSLTVVST